MSKAEHELLGHMKAALAVLQAASRLAGDVGRPATARMIHRLSAELVKEMGLMSANSKSIETLDKERT